MQSDIDRFKENLKRLTLLMGVLQITAGCAVGFIPPPGGIDSPIVTGTLLMCGLTIMAALLLTLYGLLRPAPAAETRS